MRYKTKVRTIKKRGRGTENGLRGEGGEDTQKHPQSQWLQIQKRLRALSFVDSFFYTYRNSFSYLSGFYFPKMTIQCVS